MAFLVLIIMVVLVFLCLAIIWKRQKKMPKLCMKCVKAVKVKNPKDVKYGDHISISRSKWGIRYDHHALVSEISAKQNGNRILEVKQIHLPSQWPGVPSAIKENWEKYDLSLSDIYVIQYSNVQSFSHQERIERARNLLHSEGRISVIHYNLISNNCEHFVTYCVTGNNVSFQIKNFKNFASSNTETDFLINALRNGTICDRCFFKEKHVLSAEMTREIRDVKDYDVGDVITYCYSATKDPYHQGVIVQIHQTDPRRCEIVHYDTEKKEIIQEKFTIRLNETKVTTYDKSKITVNSAAEVCQRALSRLGERSYRAYENDSNSFAKWCKLSDYQLFHVKDYVILYVLSLIKLFKHLFSKPNVATARTIREIKGKNDYHLGDVVLFGPERASDVGIIVDIHEKKQRCDIIFLNKDKTVAQRTLTISFGCREIIQYDASVVILNPTKEVLRRAKSRLGVVCANWTPDDFTKYCKLHENQPYFIVIICACILLLFRKTVDYFGFIILFVPLNLLFSYFKFGNIACVITFTVFLFESVVHGRSFEITKLISYGILLWIGLTFVNSRIS